MLALPPDLRIWVTLSPMYVLAQFDGLAGAVRERLGGDPLSGHLSLTLDHHIGWRVRASGAMTTTAIKLPFDSLAGAWRIGPTGLQQPG